MGTQSSGRARIVASAAATLISLACGTNYVYSAWAPQFAERLSLSSTQSNLIGLFGNLGVYSLGIPVGILVDQRGPRPFVLYGAVLLGAGYFPLHQAYDSASGSMATLCFFSYLTGLGSSMAFTASVKTSALNWPLHRGTATAFPLAAFGLSAFFFSVLGSLFFPGDPGVFLKLLSWGTFFMTFIGFFFLRVVSHPAQSSHDQRSSSDHRYRRIPTGDVQTHQFQSGRHLEVEPGRSSEDAAHSMEPASTTPCLTPILGRAAATPPGHAPGSCAVPSEGTSEAACPCASQDDVAANSVDLDRSHRIDIRGLRLVRTQMFWLLFFIMAILAGVGLMTINNIGNDVNALWKYYDPSVSKATLVRNQQLQVSTISVSSFAGRLLSGIGSDFLVKSVRASRLWCLFVACLVFLAAQLLTLVVQNPHFLTFVSALSGLGYGGLFGVFPSIVTEAFGIRGLSQNWGFMMLAPVLSSNVFNLLYGATFDRHSVFGSDGKRTCAQGFDCYRAAYWYTFAACCVGVVFTLRALIHERATQAIKDEGNRQRIA
ncbi:hypothetical protein HIM_02752 [Hirsutella minnesotensis 3608]|nr:hypothetical protein HIM_02752 [Hirsutella minnesotensis 3608]